MLDRFADAWNRHDLDALMPMMTDDCVFEASAGSQVDRQRQAFHRGQSWSVGMDVHRHAKGRQPSSYGLTPRESTSLALSRLQLGQQMQDFQVQPHQGHEQPERAVPLHVLRRAAFHLCLLKTPYTL